MPIFALSSLNNVFNAFKGQTHSTNNMHIAHSVGFLKRPFPGIPG